jgi:hypothetical protein
MRGDGRAVQPIITRTLMCCACAAVQAGRGGEHAAGADAPAALSCSPADAAATAAQDITASAAAGTAAAAAADASDSMPLAPPDAAPAAAPDAAANDAPADGGDQQRQGREGAADARDERFTRGDALQGGVDGATAGGAAEEEGGGVDAACSSQQAVVSASKKAGWRLSWKAGVRSACCRLVAGAQVGVCFLGAATLQALQCARGA